MPEERVTVDAEIAGLAGRPFDLEAPQILSALVVQTLLQVGPYARRVREALTAGLGAGVAAGFESETLPTYDLPEWFSDQSSSTPGEVGRGRESFTSQRESDPFDLQEWLEMLDPDTRQWRWWDITFSGPRIATIWVDAGGEVVFNCEELFWLLYSCGARAAVGPLLLSSAVWKVQESIGLPGDDLV
jgi:hypothetical protein